MIKFSTKSIIFCALIILPFANCSNHNESANQNNDKKNDSAIVLNWMGHWLAREGKEKLVRDIAREYEFRNQETKINLKFPQEIVNAEVYRPLLVKLYTEMINSGKFDWDIILMDHYLYEQVSAQLKDPFWGSKYLVDFETFDWFKENHKAFILEDPFYRNMTGGKLIGPFIEGFYTAFWCNKKIADQLGIKIKKTGMTYEDLKDYLKKGFEYNQKTDEKIVLICPGEDPMNLLNALVVSDLNSIDTLNFASNLKSLKKGLDALEELSVYHPIDVYNKKMDQDVVLNGKGLFVMLSSWIYNRWKIIDKVATDNLIPVELPVFEKDGPAYQGTYQSVFAVFKNAPHRDQAVDLLKFWSKKETAENWLSTTKNPTGLKIRLNSTDLTQDEIDFFNYTIDKKYEKNLFNYSLLQFLFGSKNRNIKLNVADILNGKLTSREAYEKVVKQLKR